MTKLPVGDEDTCKVPRVLTFVSCGDSGATVLLSNMALALHSQLGNNLLCVSDHREQVQGILAQGMKRGLKISVVDGVDDHTRFLEHVAAFRQLVSEFRPDVVQVHSNWQLAIAAAARQGRHKFRIGYWIHGFRHNSPVKAVFATALIGTALGLWADIVVASSAVVEERFRFLGARVFRLLLGVDDEFFGEYVPPPATGPLRFVFAGQFRKGKNQDMLVRAFASLEAGPAVELVLPGEGPLRITCMQLADRLGLHDRVNFPGQISRKELLLLVQNCHCALVPANNETFGSFIAEPLVVGRPVISRRVGCASDVIQHGGNGFLFEKEGELPGLLERLIRHPDLCDKMGKASYADREMFSWKRIAVQYVDHIKSILINPSGARNA